MRHLIILVFSTALTFAQPPDGVVARAMRDELARSMEKLQLEKLDKPYFVSYRVAENEGRRVSANFGTLAGSQAYHSRYLTVEVRVGDYKLDSTNFLSPSMGGAGVVRMFGGTVGLPIEDDYREIRRQLWLATDGAYKKALEDMSKKRAALANKTREEIPDFSREQPATISEDSAPERLAPAEMEKLARDLSALFREAPDVANSSVQLLANHSRVFYLSSEGAAYRRARGSVTLTVRAATQAADGLPLEDSAAWYGHSMADLPPRDQLAARVRAIGTNLKNLRAASTIDQYNGPVLFEGAAAAELLNQAFAPNLAGTRRPIADNPQYDRMLAAAENPFQDRIGGRVLPDFLSISDNPAAAEHDKLKLAGGYKVDDDGVPARETRLVEKGLLITLLMSRNPVRGIAQSTGNRRGTSVAPSNLFVRAENAVGAQELRERLVALVKQRGKEYGVVVRSIGNPGLRLAQGGMIMAMSSQPGELRVEPAVLAYKVFPDGREELVRNAEISGLTAASFKDILAASREQTVYTTQFRGRRLPTAMFIPEPGLGDASSVVVSYVVPSLLFEDVTLKKPSGEFPKPPVAAHPFFDR